MYTQTGRTGGPKGRENSEENKAGKVAEGTRLKYLGSSDDSQSSCLLVSRFLPSPTLLLFLLLLLFFSTLSPRHRTDVAVIALVPPPPRQPFVRRVRTDPEQPLF